MTTEHVCVDCKLDPPKTVRAAPHGGPRSKRCATHYRAIRKNRKSSTHDKYVQRTYGLRPGEYELLKEMQGGRCWICQRATGASRALSCDHDHLCCPEAPTCGNCTRGLLCKTCNYDLIGKYDVEALLRAAKYLISPPGYEFLAEIRGEN